jgi:hypothetical protein
MTNQAPQQGSMQPSEFEHGNFQQANASNPSGQTQTSQGHPTAHPQLSEHFTDVEGMMGNTIPQNSTFNRVENEDRNFPYWSKEFTDLWSFPGGEFGFDDLAFMQQL